jgi:hypothetical protein
MDKEIGRQQMLRQDWRRSNKFFLLDRVCFHNTVHHLDTLNQVLLGMDVCIDWKPLRMKCHRRMNPLGYIPRQVLLLGALHHWASYHHPTGWWLGLKQGCHLMDWSRRYHLTDLNQDCRLMDWSRGCHLMGLNQDCHLMEKALRHMWYE